jgi:lysophospholipase L1-like esterase
MQRKAQPRAPRGIGFGSALALAIIAGAGSASAASSGDWVGVWSASVQPVWTPDFPLPIGLPRSLWLQTLRQIVRVSAAGHKVRVALSNEYGDAPLTISAAHVARGESGAATVAGSDRALTFAGKGAVSIPPGARMISDPVDLEVPALSNLAISLYFGEATPVTTIHWEGVQTAYIVAGDHTGDADIKPDAKSAARAFVSEVLVDAVPSASTIVAYGDSITDGANSTVDANHRWPDILAEHIHKSYGDKVTVLNEAISGERVLSDRMGANALAHFDRDVLSQPHVATVVLMMGINDIGWPGMALAPHQAAPSAEDIIAGYRQLIDRAHMRGVRIIGATLTPFEDTFKGAPFEGYYNDEKEQKRQAVNAFIRSGAFDGVIDFDILTRDPANPKHIQAGFDSGDHLHPNDAGYKAMADAVDLKLLLGE